MTRRDGRIGDPGNAALAGLVFAASLAVYLVTLTPTVPFWDSGEYIAVSWILGVPHAPGTPLYVLLGRVATLVPWGTVAERVNALSAVASAVAVLFTYLITVRAANRLFDGDRRMGRHALPYLAGIVAALLTAFGTTFWTNAIEAEVYALASALMAVAVWLVLRWGERVDEPGADVHLLLVTYLVALGVGVHLGVALVGWAAVAFVFATRPAYLRRFDYLGWAVVTVALGTGINPLTFLWAPLVLVVALVLGAVRHTRYRLALGASLVFLLGLSVHLFLLLRAHQDPIINEGSPTSLGALWSMLTREQFQPGSVFDRRADLGFQFGPMYFRYLAWNFSLFTSGGRGFYQLPLLLTLAGAVVQILRDRRGAAVFGTLFLFLGPLMVVYLNFNTGEVRERDYFFVQHYQFLAVWTGLGTAWFVASLRDHMRSPVGRRVALSAGIVSFVLLFLLPLEDNWREHDRRGFSAAGDYAHNMLVSLEPDAVLFTNGDNDTFPLWYLQEVEGYRRDVRVVNLNLLNTTWYLRQIRDLEPRVPLTFGDEEIDRLRPFVDPRGGVVTVRDLAVRSVMAANDGERPLYMAVTVPDRMGLEDRLVLEGLVFRILEESHGGDEPAVDIERTRENLHERYRYGTEALRDPTNYAGRLGTFDPGAFKDDNSGKLVQNYAAAFSRLAWALLDEGRPEEALVEIERAEDISPNFPGVAITKGYVLERLGRYDEAIAHYEAMMDVYPGEWQIPQRAGASLVQRGDYEDAIPYFDRALGLSPGVFDPYQGLLSAYYNLGDYESALAVMRRWAALRPDDQGVRELIRRLERSIRTGEDPFGESAAEGEETEP